MQRPPRDPKSLLLIFPLLVHTRLVTLIPTAGVLDFFAWERAIESTDLDKARAAIVIVMV